MVASARKLIGATNPLQAEPGTIRGDLAIQTGRLNFFTFFYKIYEFGFSVYTFLCPKLYHGCFLI